MKQFSNLYSLSKTLRFELKPVGKTIDFIESKGILKQDEDQAESYQLMKKTIDGFHKHFIELAMGQVNLTHLQKFEELYNTSPERKKEDTYKKELEKVQANLRKEIVKGFTSDVAKYYYSNIDKKALFTELLTNWIPNDKMITELSEWNTKTKEEKEHLIYFDKKFENFTTYFGGFHKNRENMYTDKEQSTAISYRLIHENLPKFLDNIKIYKGVKDKGLDFSPIEKELEPLLQGTPLDEIFELNNFENTLTQKGINFYNFVLGGYSEEKNKKIRGVNEFINNEFNQKPEFKSSKKVKLKQLYKQILSDRDSISFLPDAFEDDEEKTASQKVLEAINLYYRDNLIGFKPKKDDDKTENVLEETKKLLAELSLNNSYDLAKIYIRNDKAITDISQALFNDYSVIKSALEFQYRNITYPNLAIEHKNNLAKFKLLSETEKKDSAKPKLENLEKELEKYLKQPYFSVTEIEKALFGYKKQADVLESLKEDSYPVADYFKTHFKAKKKEENDKDFDLIANIEAKYSCIKGILNSDYPKDKKLNQEKKTIDDIKAFLDSLMELLHFVKPLALPNDSTLEKDESFYSHFEVYYEQLQLLITLYNKVRNFATQKSYSTQKFKLNFENKSQFLGGWVDSHTENSDNATQAGGYLFRKKNGYKDEYDYYVGFSSDVKLFRSHLQNKIEKNDKSEFERLDYYQLKSASVYGNSYVGGSYEEDKNKLFETIYRFAEKSNILMLEDFNNYVNKQSGDNKPTPSGLVKIVQEKYPNCFNDLLNDVDFEKANKDITDKLKATILSLHRVPKSQTFKDISFSLFTEPIKAIEELSNEKAFLYFPVSKIEFEESTSRSEKPLFLFKITNKDLSFSETFKEGKRKEEKRGRDNLHTMYFKTLMSGNQTVFDIGTAEVFFRLKSIEFESEIMKKGHHYNELKDKFSYPIISNKRYTCDKFQFHISIVQNYQAPKNPPSDYNFNVLKYLKNNPEVNIIGLDRGERHLIYLTLINQKGVILQQESLNSIINKQYNIETPYHQLLQIKEDERAKARENWGVIENIKELKEGYISQVVHKIAKMMVEHNAIVVMEDLNFGFKRGRFKVEKQVYQKLEKMLIDKLNYLVFKDKNPNEAGGLYNALQLTNKFKSFKEMGKQSGFMFYVPAWNTSKIDPTTGFVNLFNTKYESVPKAQDFFLNFDSIIFNKEKEYFEFAFDYNKFTTRAENTKTQWTVCTYGDRIITFRNADANNQWDNKEVNLTHQFEDFFGKYNISYGNENCIKDEITAQSNKAFFKGLLDLFKLTLQMRNSITNSEVDYLISPVKNNKGEFYDSRNAHSTLPKDADANGAYHIAKKGLMWLDQIKGFDGTDWKKLNLEKSNKGWLNYVQSSVEDLVEV